MIFTDHTQRGEFGDANIVAYSADSGKQKTILHGGSYARYLPSGHLIYVHNGTLFAVPFDSKSLDVTGQSVPILEDVEANIDSGGSILSVSESGTLLFVPGLYETHKVSIDWVDASGKFTPLFENPGIYYNLSFSPNGKRLAFDITTPKGTYIWIYDFGRETLARLTFAGNFNSRPIWTPDGQRIVYSFSKNWNKEPANLYWIRADGGGDPQQLAKSDYNQVPRSWSPDGKTLAFYEYHHESSSIITMGVEGNETLGWQPGQPKLFVNNPATASNPAFSPDGHWIAYSSSESGARQVFVRPFPGPGGKFQISTDGGDSPEWSRNGKELFYSWGEQKIMVVNYTSSGDSFHADKPRQWSPGQFTPRGDGTMSLHPDGKRFAVLKAPNATEAPPINKVSFIFNFFDELRRKLPAGKN